MKTSNCNVKEWDYITNLQTAYSSIMDNRKLWHKYVQSINPIKTYTTSKFIQQVIFLVDTKENINTQDKIKNKDKKDKKVSKKVSKPVSKSMFGYLTENFKDSVKSQNSNYSLIDLSNAKIMFENKEHQEVKFSSANSLCNDNSVSLGESLITACNLIMKIKTSKMQHFNFIVIILTSNDLGCTPVEEIDSIKSYSEDIACLTLFRVISNLDCPKLRDCMRKLALKSEDYYQNFRSLDEFKFSLKDAMKI